MSLNSNGAPRPFARGLSEGRFSCSPAPLPGDGCFGIYVHYPWCTAKCPYCSFVSHPGGGCAVRDRDYTDALLAELAIKGPLFSPFRLGSVYFGGGTPSLWEPAQLSRFLDHIRALHPHLDHSLPGRPPVEVTLEVNPAFGADVDRLKARLGEFRRAGVNRISMGVQSFDDQVLARLGREHDGAGALAAVHAARQAGFQRISIDLMVGGPGQTPPSLLRELEVVAGLDGVIEHVSVYGLTIEEGTPFARSFGEGTLALPDEDSQAELLQVLHGQLLSLGYDQYEVCSYTKPGGRSRHNMLYWVGAPYLGLGVAAHSHLPSLIGGAAPRPKASRWAGPADPAQYMDSVKEGNPEYLFEEEIVDQCSLFEEQLLTGLRLRDGVDLSRLCAYYGVSVDMGVIRTLCEGGYLQWGNGRGSGAVREEAGGTARQLLQLSEEGWLIVDELTLRICRTVKELPTPEAPSPPAHKPGDEK